MQLAPGGVSRAGLLLVAATLRTGASVLPQAQGLRRLGAPSGLQLLIDADNAAPTLRVTVSSDTAWVIASFTRTTGNVWSNPELTCQHVDPQTTLAPGATAATEMKILVLRGSLRSAYQRMLQQRSSLH